MAQQLDGSQRSFRLYITHVDGDGPFLKLSGQLDKQSTCLVESLIESARASFDSGIGTVSPAAITEGLICAAKYKDGTYYRAKILSIANISSGLVNVHFIDYGNKDVVSLSTIRFLDSYDPLLRQIRGQATDYYLAEVVQSCGRWEEPMLLKLQSLLCYSEYTAVLESTSSTIPIISVQFQGTDLSEHLRANRYGIAISLVRQELLVMKHTTEIPQQVLSQWQANFPSETTEHVPFLGNQAFPSNPASAMRLQQNMAYNGNYMPPPSAISQRLIANKAPRVPVNIRVPQRSLNQTISVNSSSLPPTSVPPPFLSKMPSPVKPMPAQGLKTYQSRLLEVGSSHQVFVSYAEEGPEIFAVQLASDGKKLDSLMDEINRQPHKSLQEPPMIGTVCLGRMSNDRMICRAIVTSLSGQQCKLFFVDFGDTELVSYYDMFDIPEKYIQPYVFAMRFCLSQVKKLPKNGYINELFEQLVNNKLLTLKVVPAEAPPLLQYGELYLDGKNVFDILYASMKDTPKFKPAQPLAVGSRCSVLVSYVDSCLKFFIQLSDKIDELNDVMDGVKRHCESSASPGELPVGAACCAKFSDDGNWYRATVIGANAKKTTVSYIDYGNEQDVIVSDLRTITPNLMELPAQALKCALMGYEDKVVETKTSNQLEMLALEKTLMAHVTGMLSDTMLVSLLDDSVNPPLDIARRMNQLSQPRSSHDSKTPTRKDPPADQFSSPESISDDRKKGFRREKSFKDDRGSRDGNEDFGQRGGSFRRENNRDGFDRSGPGRNSDKFARPDRGERRGPPKSRDEPFSGSDNVWDESSSQPSYQSQQGNKQFRDKRKPRNDEDQSRPGSNRRDGPPNRRFQDNEPRSSVQDRLKRETKQNDDDGWGENSTETQNRSENQNRFDRRDNRGERTERRDNWGERTERRDNWGENKEGYQKREFRDNKGDRSERPPRTSNFTPRDRANKTWDDKKSDRPWDDKKSDRPWDDKKSDRAWDDKKSDRSFGSDGGKERSGRAPPYKSRSKFTQVQYKDLTDPVPLETAFEEHQIEPNAQHEVSVTWIISPDSFYTQILSSQTKFLEMMHKIPEIYKGVKPFTGNISVGASVLAKYPEDGVLYRATVISVQPFGKFIVQYIDFGNKFLVDARDIWQLDRELMELPKMAVHCSLIGVAPKDGEWKASSDIDLCFNAPRYQCVFQDNVEGKCNVSLWNNGTSVADLLVEKELAVASEYGVAVTLKDEAIDLSIIVGQQINCRVTNVVSFDKLYVQLDLQKAALVEEAIANFDVSLLAPLSADSLADGVHCTVKHDGKIYRAILNDTSQTNDIKAVLPDYGISISTSLENLMILPTELTVYYYQSLECCLNNYTEESEKLMSLDQLKEKLTNNKFITYINDVDGVRVVTTLYDPTDGSKIPIFSPDEGAYDTVTPLCAHAIYNYNCGLAYVSHTEALNEIYLQRSADSDRLAALLDSLYKFYQEGTPEPLTEYEEGGLCAGLSSDGNWYRAIINSSTENECTVQFPDYGNCETIAKESIKKLDPQFYEPCMMALVVSLGLNAVSDDALSKFKEWTEEKEVQVTLNFGNEGWLANLHLDGVDLALKLVNEKLATPQAVADPLIESNAEEPISLPPGCTKVYISHIDTPGHFWLQMADKVDAIEEIQTELQEKAESYENIVDRDMGVICAAKYSADDQWYRAEILDSDADITTVRFIDYGNTDVLDNVPGLLKTLPDHLKSIDPYAIKASVNAVPTGTGQWSEPSADYFVQLVGDISEPVDAMIVLKDVMTYVDVYVKGQNLTDKLVEQGHATRTEVTQVGGDLPSCFASHVNTPSEFWIQLETATPELQTMEDSMVDAENFPELIAKEEGVICAAKYPEDGAWYRAQVIVDGSEGTEVLFIDYGNASITTELKNLPEELKTKPALSRKCALQKPRDIKAWSQKSELKFNELAAEGATIFNVQFIASGDISIVELYLNGKSVTEELVELCEKHPDTERPAPVGQDLQVSGKICYFNSHEEFYIHIDGLKDMETVVDKLIDVEEFQSATELKVGSLCAAFWDEDEQWYRAKILEFCDVGAHVQFIDYGNKAKCEQFKQLPDDLTALEAIAKCCRIAGEVSHEGKKKFEEMCADNPTFQIDFLDSTVSPILVKLTLDGEDVSSIIRKADATNNEPEKTIKTELGTVLPDTTSDSDISNVIKTDPPAESKSETNNDKEIIASTDDKVPLESKGDDTLEKKPETVEYIDNNLEKKTEVVEIEQKSSESVKIEEPTVTSDIETKSLETEPKNKTEQGITDSNHKNHEEILNSSNADEFQEASDEMNANLNESLESNDTVIENKSFESALDQDILIDNDKDTTKKKDQDETEPQTIADKSSDLDTLESSDDTIKTTEKDTSSLSDGYTSCTELDKTSLKDDIKDVSSEKIEDDIGSVEELPVQPSAEGDCSPAKSSVEGDKLPVKPSAQGDSSPHGKSSVEGDKLPVKPSTEGDKLPVQPSAEGDILPVQPSAQGDCSPAKSSEEGDKLPVKPSAQGDSSPDGKSSVEGDKLPVQPSAEGDKLPVQPSA